MGISPLELYIKTTLGTSGKKSLPKVYLQKAVALINAKINPVCCEGNDPIDLHTSFDNVFTSTVSLLLNSMERNGNLAVLNKAKALINYKLGTPCCI